MNSFRYIIAKYKFNEENKPPINIGVIIQSDEQILCKFNSDLSLVKKINGNQQLTDEFVFASMGDTFTKRFAEGTTSITDHETKEKKVIKYTDPQYLDYLNTNFLNNYIYTDRGIIQADSIDEGLSNLYKNFIDPRI